MKKHFVHFPDWSARVWAAVLLAGGLGFSGSAGAAASASLSRAVPDAAVISFEVLRPDALLDPLLSDAFARRVQGLPFWSQITASSGFQEFRGGVGLFETALGTNWREALRELAGGGLIVAAAPGNRATLLVESRNPERLQKFHDLVAQIATTESAKRGAADRVRSSTRDGVTCWSFDGKELHAVIGSRLVVASDPEVFDRVLATAKGPVGASLAGRPRYQAARRAVGPDAAAMLFVDLQAIRQAPGMARLLQGPRGNPLGALVAGNLPAALQSADWLAVGVQVRGDTLAFQAVLGPAPAASAGSTAAADFTSGARARLLPDPNVPGEVAALRLNRDLHRFYAAKDERFPNRTSGLIFFENMMGIFFSGRDLTDEVFAALEPEINFIVARQDFAEDASVPTPELPGFALVLRLRDPAAFRPVLEEAWQKALGLVSFTRGQKAEMGFVLDRPRYGDVTYTTARFASAGLTPEARRDIRFNFQPTLAMRGDFAILSSSESLARALLDALARPDVATPKSERHAHTRLSLHGPALTALLAANQEVLVRNNMVEKGHTRAEAERDIRALLALARQIKTVDLSWAGAPGPATARLAIRFAPASR